MPLKPQQNESACRNVANAIPVSTSGFASVVIFALACIGFHWFSSDAWFPLLDSANLALHEAGHPLLGIFSSRLMVYGGTLAQLIFPLAIAWNFCRAGNLVGFAVAGIWLGESLFNVARYMADARAQELPLVGGGEHDWTEIFSRWGVLSLDGRIAGMTRALALTLILATVIWLYRCWRNASEN